MILRFYVPLSDFPELSESSIVAAGYIGYHAVGKVKDFPKDAAVNTISITIGDNHKFTVHVFPKDKQLYISDLKLNLWNIHWTKWSNHFPSWETVEDQKNYKTFFVHSDEEFLYQTFCKDVGAPPIPEPTVSLTDLWHELKSPVYSKTTKSKPAYKWVLSYKGLTINGEQECDASSVTPF